MNDEAKLTADSAESMSSPWNTLDYLLCLAAFTLALLAWRLGTVPGGQTAVLELESSGNHGSRATLRVDRQNSLHWQGRAWESLADLEESGFRIAENSRVILEATDVTPVQVVERVAAWLRRHGAAGVTLKLTAGSLQAGSQQ